MAAVLGWLPGEVTCPDRDLSPGDTVVCTALLTAGEPGMWQHTAWAWAWTAGDAEVEAADPVSYRIVERDLGPGR